MIEKGFAQELNSPLGGQPYPGLVFYGSFTNEMCYVTFEFKGNAFYTGEVIEKSYNTQPVLKAFDHFVKLVTDKYGMPQERKCYTTNKGVCGNSFAYWKLCRFILHSVLCPRRIPRRRNNP